MCLSVSAFPRLAHASKFHPPAGSTEGHHCFLTPSVTQTPNSPAHIYHLWFVPLSLDGCLDCSPTHILRSLVSGNLKAPFGVNFPILKFSCLPPFSLKVICQVMRGGEEVGVRKAQRGCSQTLWERF